MPTATEQKEILQAFIEDERDLDYSDEKVRYGATEGPLKTLIPVFIDFETWMSGEVKLGSMTLRQYLNATHLTAMSIAVGYDEPEVYLIPDGNFLPSDEVVLLVLEELALDPNYVFVAHNAAFDIRVLKFLVGTTWPKNVWCTMEGAMGAWPELPGGYSLKNIGKRLDFKESIRKIDIDLSTCTDEQLLEYNKRDVRVLQELYQREAALLPALEQEVALRTHRQRQFYFNVGQDKLVTLISELEKQAFIAEQAAGEYLADEDLGEVFNRDEGPLRSVRSQRLLKIINTKMGGDFKSTSLKKISPLKLAQNQPVAALLQQTSMANKMLSHARRSKVFIDVESVDVELGYARAHTGRFSSPGVGSGSRGLNLHNVPKHQKAIAKPIRSIFRLPKHQCFVRADLCNVEYRVEGKLFGCKTVEKMFDPKLGGNVFNDPYCEAWYAMVGQRITKKDPIRQVAKAAVLGLGFLMGATGYARGTLLPALSNKESGVTEEMLHNIAQNLDWKVPQNDGVKRVMVTLGCSQIVALSSYWIHNAFNRAHPEFAMVADWLVAVVNAVAATWDRKQGQDMIKRAYESPRAPDPKLIGLEIDDDATFARNSIRVRCGPWPRTVIWRNPKVRPTTFQDGAGDRKLTILKASGEFRPFSRQLASENCVQAAARNGLCYAVAELEKEGFPNVLHIHDELLVLTNRNRESVLKAREAMIKVVGPNSLHPLGWSCMIKPSEINVSESLWEEESDSDPKGGDRWGKLERNEPGCLDNLS